MFGLFKNHGLIYNIGMLVVIFAIFAVALNVAMKVTEFIDKYLKDDYRFFSLVIFSVLFFGILFLFIGTPDEIGLFVKSMGVFVLMFLIFPLLALLGWLVSHFKK